MNFTGPSVDAWLNPQFLQCEVCGAMLRDQPAHEKHMQWHASLPTSEPKLGNWDVIE